MQNILKRFNKRQLLAILTSLTLSFLFTVMGLSEQRSAADVTPVLGVVIEETLATNPIPTSVDPGDTQQLGWTAWSG